MTGSDMGGLAIGFLKYIAFFFALVFAGVYMFTGGVIQVVAAVLAVIFGIVYVVCYVGIKRFEKRFYESRDSARDQQNHGH
jgi:uncharacterized ion transporter superfamily protein YfcC